MIFGGNTRDLRSFREETNEITDLHQILEEVLLTECGDSVTSIKRRRRDPFINGVWNLETASGRGRLKEDLESSKPEKCQEKHYCYASTKAEYIAAVKASMEAVWIRKFIDRLGDVVPLNKRPMEMLYKMSRDVITVGSIMRIPLLYMGEYSQCRERFMNYFEEQTDDEAMINSIQNGDVNDALGYKKKVVVVTLDPLALVAEKMKVSKCKEKVEVQTESEESDEDISDLKKITALLAKTFNQKKYYAKPTNSNLRTSSASSSVNKKPEYVKSMEKKEDKKANEKKRDIRKVKCYNCKKEGHFAKDCKKAKVKYYNYYKTKMLLVKKDSDEQVLLAGDQAWMECGSDSDQEINANMVFMAQIEKKILEKETKILELDGRVSNKDVEIEKCLERFNECENKLHKIGQTNQTIHMILPSKDTLYNGKKGIGFENPSYFGKAKDLRPSLCDEKVIGLGYTPMFLIHSDEALEIKKFKRARENKIEFAYDYGNLNASYVNEKINVSDDYFQEIINLDFEKIDSPFQQTSSLKLYVPTVILEKIIIDLEDEVVSILEKENANLKIIESLKSKGFESSENAISESENQSEKECDHVENSKVIASRMFKLNLDTFSSVIRPNQSNVIWKKKGSSNTFNVDLSYVSHSKLNKDVKQYSHKDLLSCNNSHLGETSSAYVCNDAMNLSCNSRLGDSFDENNLFVFDDESVRISPIVQICLWIIDSGCSKHMTGNRALLTNFVEKFLGTVCFGNNDFVVIAGYRDVVIGSMTIKKVYYVEGLGHNLFSVGQFFDKGLERVQTDNGTEFKNKTLAKFFDEVGITQQFSATRTPQQNGVVERRNRTLVEAARIILTFTNLPSFLWAEAIAIACFTQNHSIIYKSFDKIPYELINKRKPNIKFFHVFRCRCYLLNDYEDDGKLKTKGDIGVFVGYSKESVAFRIYNKQTRKIHESVNVNFDEISKMASKQFSLEPGLSNLNETGKSPNPSVSQVLETSKKDLEDLFQKFYDEYFDASKIMKSSTTNVETSNVEVPSNEEEVFHEKVEVPSSNTQSVLNNMVPNADEASTSHNVFNECLEDAYFDASTSFHDPSNVHTFYQPYPHEKKWIKDHPLHNIIGDLKSSVHTKGQLANLCLFSCLLSSIEPSNVAEALRVAYWDVKTTFLNEILKEKVYVGQPTGFFNKQYPDHMYALDKALCGLKQAPRAWYGVLSQFLIESGF
nr:hypothetical protein [Tanacetum cinerariifolium]